MIDEDLDEEFRVTIVATGIGGNSNEVKAMPRVVRRTGTDDAVAEVIRENDDKTPAVVRRRGRQVVVDALKKDGVEDLDIPAFLRRSAD